MFFVNRTQGLSSSDSKTLKVPYACIEMAKGLASKRGFTVLLASAVSNHAGPSNEASAKPHYPYYKLRQQLMGEGGIAESGFTKDYKSKKQRGNIMEPKNYERIDATEYLRNKYPEEFDEAVSEVAFFENTVTNARWVKVVRGTETLFGHGESVSEICLNGEECELELDDYDSLEKTVEAVCDDETFLDYELGIFMSVDEADDDVEEEGEATPEEMKEEAIRRLKLFTQMEPCVIKEFKNENVLYMSENRGILYYLDNQEKKLVEDVEAAGNKLVFHVLHYASQFGEMYTMLYVYNDKSEWEDCRENLKNCGTSYCYTYNKDHPFLSEHGSIGVIQINGGLMVNNSIFGMPL